MAGGPALLAGILRGATRMALARGSYTASLANYLGLPASGIARGGLSIGQMAARFGLSEGTFRRGFLAADRLPSARTLATATRNAATFSPSRKRTRSTIRSAIAPTRQTVGNLRGPRGSLFRLVVRSSNPKYPFASVKGSADPTQSVLSFIDQAGINPEDVQDVVWYRPGG